MNISTDANWPTRSLYILPNILGNQKYTPPTKANSGAPIIT